MKKRGRPTRLNSELTRQICQLLSEGITVAATCDALGVAESRYFEWLKQEEFQEQATRARAKGKIELVRQILADKDWRAKAWYLERCWPREFARSVDRPLPVDEDKQKMTPFTITVNTNGKTIQELTDFPYTCPKCRGCGSPLRDNRHGDVEINGTGEAGAE